MFFDSVGRNTRKAWKRIQRIFCHVQAAYCHVSLGSKIHVDIGNSAHLVQNLRTEFDFGHTYTTKVVNPTLKPTTRKLIAADPSINLVAYLTNNEGQIFSFQPKNITIQIMCFELQVKEEHMVKYVLETLVLE